MLIRRLSIVVGGAATALALTAGSATAHYCFFNDPNPKANEGRAGSSAFRTFESIAVEFAGLCPAGVEIAADAAGVEPDTLINARGAMAGPTGGNKPISHLDFAGLDAALGTPEDPGPAFLACL